MMIADITLAAFMFCNSLRFAAYIPQITKAIRDQGGAEAISFGAWSMFLISHASAMAKTLVNNERWSAGFMFLATIIGCSAILFIAGRKRSHDRNRTTPGTPVKRIALQPIRSEEHTSELQSHSDLVCRL